MLGRPEVAPLAPAIRAALSNKELLLHGLSGRFVSRPTRHF